MPSDARYCTIELPWRNNEPKYSCIPAGQYDVTIQYSARFKRDLYRLDDAQTAPRSAILIHVGNFAGDMRKGLRSDFLGCIGLGKKAGTLQGQRAVLLSTDAIREFYAELNRQPFRLVIEPITRDVSP